MVLLSLWGGKTAELNKINYLTHFCWTPALWSLWFVAAGLLSYSILCSSSRPQQQSHIHSFYHKAIDKFYCFEKYFASEALPAGCYNDLISYHRNNSKILPIRKNGSWDFDYLQDFLRFQPLLAPSYLEGKNASLPCVSDLTGMQHRSNFFHPISQLPSPFRVERKLFSVSSEWKPTVFLFAALSPFLFKLSCTPGKLQLDVCFTSSILPLRISSVFFSCFVPHGITWDFLKDSMCTFVVLLLPRKYRGEGLTI